MVIELSPIPETVHAEKGYPVRILDTLHMGFGMLYLALSRDYADWLTSIIVSHAMYYWLVRYTQRTSWISLTSKSQIGSYSNIASLGSGIWWKGHFFVYPLLCANQNLSHFRTLSVRFRLFSTFTYLLGYYKGLCWYQCMESDPPSCKPLVDFLVGCHSIHGAVVRRFFIFVSLNLTESQKIDTSLTRSSAVGTNTV